jgi:hypothetical protein
MGGELDSGAEFALQHIAGSFNADGVNGGRSLYRTHENMQTQFNESGRVVWLRKVA